MSFHGQLPFPCFLLLFLIKIFIAHIRLTRPEHSLSRRLRVTRGEPLQAPAWILNQEAPGEEESSHRFPGEQLGRSSDQSSEGCVCP